MSRLQASLHVAARVLAPRCAACAASRALDAPLGLQGLPRQPGACYPALRRLPGRDSHPLDMRSMQQPLLALAGSAEPLLRDAPWRDSGAIPNERGAKVARFASAHGAIRRFAPRSDPNPRPTRVSSAGSAPAAPHSATACRTARSHRAIASSARSRESVGWKTRSACHWPASSSRPDQTPVASPAR